MLAVFFLGNGNFTKRKYLDEFTNHRKDWYYDPRNVSFDNAVEEFTYIFENLISKNTGNKKIILPLSGGLDSRTLASALRNRTNIVAYSYEFLAGVNETKYPKRISEEMGWPFFDYLIPKGYLWSRIDELSDINFCQSDFTHPRQMAVIDKVSKLGDLIISGQWGDVLFDLQKLVKMKVYIIKPSFYFKKLLNPVVLNYQKNCGVRGFDGNFDEILFDRLKNLLCEIKIDNPSRRILAFKSIHWAHRWSNPNLNIFSNNCELLAPYYENSICEFICRTPNNYLRDRKIQNSIFKKYFSRVGKNSLGDL